MDARLEAIQNQIIGLQNQVRAAVAAQHTAEARLALVAEGRSLEVQQQEDFQAKISALSELLSQQIVQEIVDEAEEGSSEESGSQDGSESL